MRAITAPEQAVLEAAVFRPHWRVLVADADAAMRDYTGQAGFNWLQSVTWGADIDQPVVEARVTLRRDVGATLSLSPLRTDSTLNRNAAAAYAPAIDAGRALWIDVATTAAGVEPIAGDWKRIFTGTIDVVDATKEPLEIIARDQGGELVDRWIESDKHYGTEAGQPLATVMQAILDDALGAGVVTLYVPTAPGGGYTVKHYNQASTPVFDAIRAQAQKIGWDVRYKWDAGTSSFRLTLFQPDRTKTIPDYTFTPALYTDVTRFALDRSGIRNYIKVYYIDTADDVQKSVTASDATSIAKYGRHFQPIDETKESSINTAALAQALADVVLADLKDPKAEQEIETLFFWPVELGDLYRFAANAVHYDTAQDLAVVSFRHELSLEKQVTYIQTRGKPAGAYLDWQKKSATGGTVGVGEFSPDAATVTSLYMTEPSANRLRVDVEITGGIRWLLWLKLGSRPTDNGAENGSLLEEYLKATLPQNQLSLVLDDAAVGTWYACAVAYDALGRAGPRTWASFAITAPATPEGTLTTFRARFVELGGIDADELYWDHNATIESPPGGVTFTLDLYKDSVLIAAGRNPKLEHDGASLVANYGSFRETVVGCSGPGIGECTFITREYAADLKKNGVVIQTATVRLSGWYEP